MTTVLEFIQNLDQNLASFASDAGPVIYVLLGLALFTQTGLVVGPFLPGTTIMFAAGMLAGGREPILNLGALLLVCLVGALIGNHANYFQGRVLGRKWFSRKEKGLVSMENLRKTEAFMDRHGKTAMIVSPFTPFIRSFAPFVAGMCEMDGRRYALFATLGVVAWVGSMVLAGSLLGTVPFVRDNIGLMFMGAFLLLTAKIGLDFVKSRRQLKTP